MGFRLVSSHGDVGDAAAVNMPASGVIHPGEVVEFSRTGGLGVTPAGMNSTVTNIFGVAYGYVQGASDTYVRVVPFANGQIWEADCIHAAATAHIGLRYGLSRTRSDMAIYNHATDSTTGSAIFRAVAMVGSTSGSGKLLGYFRRGDDSGAMTGVTGAESGF